MFVGSSSICVFFCENKEKFSSKCSHKTSSFKKLFPNRKYSRSCKCSFKYISSFKTVTQICKRKSFLLYKVLKSSLFSFDKAQNSKFLYFFKLKLIDSKFELI